ncbi:UPF0547 protein C16orf87 homolog [Ruditapes philippinarum]|uniref:UPF0547 protein C16orf87 homolog n=1 Tax=Ruditapes philippinarum TaxID=129788 RepID=UPI00295B499C|nr:UPF0547 protein C16orf87 homolog [Ruditapes philippinarum]
MRRNSTKTERSRSDFKVVKKCTECSKEIPVACKMCPLCKCYVTPAKSVKTPKDDDKEVDAKIRRTERIRRERPDFFNAMKVDNQFKKKRKRKESTASISSIGSTSTAPKPTTIPVKVPTDDADAPKRRRGRPKSVASVCASIDPSDKGSETKSPLPEEDWYANLPPEKFMQYKIILAEINRKFSTQNFKPV